MRSACSGCTDNCRATSSASSGSTPRALYIAASSSCSSAGVVLEFVSLLVHLGANELVLRGDRHELAGRHRQRAGRQPGQTGEHDCAVRSRAAGNAGDQGDVRDQAVHRAEYSRPQPAAGHIAVLVPVRLACLQATWGANRGGGRLITSVIFRACLCAGSRGAPGTLTAGAGGPSVTDQASRGIAPGGLAARPPATPGNRRRGRWPRAARSSGARQPLAWMRSPASTSR